MPVEFCLKHSPEDRVVLSAISENISVKLSDIESYERILTLDMIDEIKESQFFNDAVNERTADKLATLFETIAETESEELCTLIKQKFEEADLKLGKNLVKQAEHDRIVKYTGTMGIAEAINLVYNF